MEKARGRPAKKRPKVPPEAVTAVKIMVKTQHGYEGAKKRSEYYPLKRPSLMRRLKVDTNDYESTGKIEYDRELVKRIHENDQRYIRQYERDMELIWIIEHGVSSIPDERTRRIAEDTILKNKPVMQLLKKYSLSRSQMFWEKQNAIRYIARTYMEWRPE